jgi:hypothetical protein
VQAATLARRHIYVVPNSSLAAAAAAEQAGTMIAVFENTTRIMHGCLTRTRAKAQL